MWSLFHQWVSQNVFSSQTNKHFVQCCEDVYEEGRCELSSECSQCGGRAGSRMNHWPHGPEKSSASIQGARTLHNLSSSSSSSSSSYTEPTQTLLSTRVLWTQTLRTPLAWTSRWVEVPLSVMVRVTYTLTTQLTFKESGLFVCVCLTV